MMSGKQVVRVGSRKSALALAQTNLIIAKLKEQHPSIEFQLVTMDTIGDKILDVALSKIGDKNLFTKELESALLVKEVDFVVHSLKDMPTSLSSEFVLACICQRIDKYDVAVFPAGKKSSEMRLEDLPKGSVVGTSAVRRVSQLQRRYPHLKFASVRGNLNTRLRKLDAENSDYDAIILAKAGLIRLGMEDRIGEDLTEDGYAVGQGALTCECRADDLATRALLSSVHDEAAALTSICERSFMRELDGGCSTPISVDARLDAADRLSLRGRVMSVDGGQVVETSLTRKLPRTADALIGRVAWMRLETGDKRSASEPLETTPPKMAKLESGVFTNGHGHGPSDPTGQVFLGLVVHPICGPAVARMQTAVSIGKMVAQTVLEEGAAEILDEIRQHLPAKPLAKPTEPRVVPQAVTAL